MGGVGLVKKIYHPAPARPGQVSPARARFPPPEQVCPARARSPPPGLSDCCNITLGRGAIYGAARPWAARRRRTRTHGQKTKKLCGSLR